MFPSLPSSLDQLASEGIINFDAEAFVKGTTPRYVGSPHNYLPFEQPLNTYNSHVPVGNNQAPMLPSQPKQDEFHKSEHKKPVPWKTLLAGGIFATIIAALGIRYRGKIASLLKSKVTNTAVKPAKTNTKATTAQTEAAKTQKTKKPIKKWLKYTVGGALSAFVLYIGAKIYARKGQNKNKTNKTAKH